MDLKTDARESPATKIGRRVARHQDAELAARQGASLEDRLAAIHRREAKEALVAPLARRTRRLVFAFAACLVALGALLFVGSRRPIFYEIHGTRGAPGEWVAAEATLVALDFSDGSRVDVSPGGRARVTELGRRGASVLLEKGALRVRVVPREDNAWAIVAGPFTVNVVGTEFDVAWDVESEALTVSMLAGHVRIDGACVAEGGRDLVAPQAATLSCKSDTRTALPASPASSAPAATPPEAASPTATAGGSAIAVAPEAWRVKLSAGKMKDAFAAAETAGIDTVLASASGTELVEMGSAARLSGKPEVARQLYTKARERFQHSDAAATAAYHLGRMAFDGRGAWSEADRWFAVYLSERPGGTLAPEALGRSLECADKLGDGARAKEIARRYLAAYPTGAHANLAKTLAEKAE